ncbi:MAG: hypothetical protein RLZZ119_258, partial [Pseudomonadota bacterium]
WPCGSFMRNYKVIWGAYGLEVLCGPLPLRARVVIAMPAVFAEKGCGERSAITQYLDRL